MATKTIEERVPSHEERARLIANVMQSRRGSEIGQALAERAALISSVKWLGNHVPVCVLNRLGEEIRLRRSELQDDGTTSTPESGTSGHTGDSSFSDEMVLTQDLLSQIRRERDEGKRGGKNLGEVERNGGLEDFLATGLKPLSEEEDDDVSLEHREIFMPRPRRRYSSDHDECADYFETLQNRNSQSVSRRGSTGRRLSMDRRGSMERRSSTDRRASMERRSSTDRRVSAERRSSMDRRGSIERRNSVSRRGSMERRSSVDRRGLMERRGSSRGSVRRNSSNRSSYQSFAEISELSFDYDHSESDGSLFSSDGADFARVSDVEEEAAAAADAVADTKQLPPDLLLPYASSHKCALLFVDISGFTRLSTRLDPEKLSKVINSYFELIVNLVTAHGGDVLKFAGDAIFAEWQASPEDSEHSSNNSHNLVTPITVSRRSVSLEACVASAATCGARIVLKCSDFPIYESGKSGGKGGGEVIGTLNVHCGLGAGDIVGVHVGSATKRREYLILGHPIDQVAMAAEHASLGELHASPEALAIMAESSLLLPDALANAEGIDKPALIARKNLACFTPKAPKQQRRCSVTHLWEGWDTDLLEDYRQLICSYAHPVIVDNEMNVSHHLYLSNSTAKQRQVEEAELRFVYVMFISMPRIDCAVGKNEKNDKALFKRLNNILDLVSRELERFHGHLRQFIVDDKGLVLIATFGLRGSTSPNLVAENALPATMVIHDALQTELNVFNRIGATVGNAYCGVVGGIKRHEYAVMGPSVNLAARLMASPQNPGILVSEVVRVRAGKVFAFKALPPVRAKGYSNPVPIFEPLSSLERRWGRQTSEFVGRTKEVDKFLELAKLTMKPMSPSRFVFLTADSGTGKTTLVVYVIDHLKKVVSKNRKRHCIAKHVCREGDVLVPFSIFRTILPDILQDFEVADESTNSGSRSSLSGFDPSEMDWDSASKYSLYSKSSKVSKESTASSDAKLSRLKRIVNDIEAPSDFHDVLVHHLLGIGPKQVAHEERSHNKQVNIAGSINYLVKLLQKWMRHSRLTILALDDVHLMDEVSWQVVQRLMESTRNLFVVCTSRPLDGVRTKIEVEPIFWATLNSTYVSEGRFVHMKLSRLGKDEIRTMIAKKFDLQEQEIDDTFHKDIYNQSRGMPAFASEILQSASRRNSIGRVVDNRIGWTRADRGKGELTRASVGDIIVHRLDTFDQIVRVVLNIGAVLGSCFDLYDMINVTQRFANSAKEDQKVYSRKVHKALHFLVAEGILLEVCIGGGENDGSVNVDFVGFDESMNQSVTNFSTTYSTCENKTYTFCHDVWRSSILNLMLESRRKHIHKVIAGSLEAEARKTNHDYGSLLKIWNHWKAAGETGKAGNLALTIGESFDELGMHAQSTKLYEDTLDLWRNESGSTTDGIGGFSLQLLESMDRNDLECVIRVHIALGKDLANLHKGADSVVAYQDALRIMQAAPAARYIRDRSLVFPIFSGLFLALKFGQIEQDDDCLYEQNLVARFVAETREHGDPVHYTRALSMQAEMYGRLNDFDAAFEAFEELKLQYDAEKLTAEISKAYGSDRSGQCFGISVLWHLLEGNMQAAVETCEYIFKYLMPKMDPKNVHNSALMIYPTIWVMKEAKRAHEMLEIFVTYVVEPFDEYLGEGAFTFCLPVYDPIMMLLDICENEENENLENFDDFVEWALEEENLGFGQVINNSLGHFGRDCNSIAGEICLLLAQRREFGTCEDVLLRQKRETLVRNGLKIMREAAKFTEEKKMAAALLQIEPVLKNLESLAEELSIEE